MKDDSCNNNSDNNDSEYSYIFTYLIILIYHHQYFRERFGVGSQRRSEEGEGEYL